MSWEGGRVGIGVYSLMSSFDITTLELKGTKLAPRNLALVFWIVIDCK